MGQSLETSYADVDDATSGKRASPPRRRAIHHPRRYRARSRRLRQLDHELIDEEFEQRAPRETTYVLATRNARARRVSQQPARRDARPIVSGAALDPRSIAEEGRDRRPRHRPAPRRARSTRASSERDRHSDLANPPSSYHRLLATVDRRSEREPADDRCARSACTRRAVSQRLLGVGLQCGVE